MPFNLYNPKPLEVYDHPHGRRRRYWPYSKYMEHLDYTPDEVRSWGSISHIPDVHHVPPHRESRRTKCAIKCHGIKPVNRYYPEQYIRDKLMLENPGLLPALKNTLRVRDVPHKPIAFTPPRFVHTNQRSQYHLLVRENDRTGLCEIAGNLQKEQQTIRELLRSSHIGRKQLLKADATLENTPEQDEKRDGGKSVKSKKSMAKGEGKGRKILKGFFDSKIQLPIPSQIPKDISQYNWSEEGGMESLCRTYPGISLFVESPSNLPLAQQPEFGEMVDGPLMNTRKTIAFANLAGVTKKLAPGPKQNSKEPIASSRAYEEFNHYGLLESAKSVALEHILKQLYRRERHVTVPKELLGTSYGSLKGAPPGYRFDKPQVPDYLHEDWPPEPEEIEKVERAMQYEKNLRKTRKARGMQSQATLTNYLSQFIKPIITESLEDVSVRTFKRPSSEPETKLEKHDSSESLIYKVAEVMIEGEPPIEILSQEDELSSTEIVLLDEVEEHEPIQEEHEDTRKSLEGHDEEEEGEYEEEDNSEGGILEGDEIHDIMNPHEHHERHVHMSVSEELEENKDVDEDPPHDALVRFDQIVQKVEVEDLSEFQDGGSLVVQESSEYLPYPDVTFSMVALPIEAKGIEKSGFYKKLADDNKSESSDDHEDEEDDEEEQETVEYTKHLDDDDDMDLEEVMEETMEMAHEEDKVVLIQASSGTSVALDKIFMKVQTFLERRASQRVGVNRRTKVIN